MTNFKSINKLRNSKIYLVILLLFIYHLSFIIYHLPKALAQSLSLSISPPLLEVMIKPGKSITQVYKLTNNGEPVVVTANISEMDSNGIKEGTAVNPDKWISIISNDIALGKAFLLESGKEAEFLIKINPPEGVLEQDYYRALVITTTPNPPTDTTMTSFSQNLISPILITITSTGVFAKGAEVTRFELPKIIDSFDPLITDIEVKNTGKVYFRPVGKISLSGPVGKGQYDIVPNVILSGQNKQLITEHLPPSAQDTKSLFLPGFYIGKYNLELNFGLDEGTTKISQTKTFYAIPWKIGLVIILILGIFTMRRRKKKK